MNIAFVHTSTAKNIGRGAGYIVSSIPKEHRVKFYDTRGIKPAAVIRKIVGGSFDILMVSSMTTLWSQAISIIKGVKASCDIPVLVGGVHPTIMKLQILEQFPYIDYVCVGEGESFVKEFLVSYGKDSLFEVPNLIYRSDGKVYTNPIRPPEDLSTLPRFPWGIFPYKVAGKYIYVNATRGCPFNCPYCCNGVYLKLYKSGYVRSRPVNQVIEELKYLKTKFEFKLFYFGDDMMFTDLDYVKRLFSAIKEEVGRPYGCMGRVEYINADLVNFMKSTDCRYVALGIECGDENFRKKHLRRSMTNEQIINAFKLLRAAGISTTSFNVIGWPFVNDDELCKSTVEINRIISPGIRQVTWFYPFPGTGMYDYCVKNDLIGSKGIKSYHRGSILKMHSKKSDNPNDYLARF